MKKLLAILLLVAGTAFAEASFDQIESLIEQKNYAAAEQGLEGIIKNHPNSAKAYYAMAQAQAGLGHLEKARYALDKATGLDPELKFASAGNVSSLREAITPQVEKIERAEPGHFWRNLFIALILGGILYWCYVVYKRSEEDDKPTGGSEPKPTPPAPPAPATDPAPKPATPEPVRATIYTPPQPNPYTAAQAQQAQANQAAYANAAYTASVSNQQPQVVHHHHTTTVQSNNDGLLTGMLIGEMLSHPHHETTRVVEREVIREVPAPSRDSSWDTPSRSSSWDDSSSSSSSSSFSWGSSSSDSSSSWDSGSSSDSSSSDW
jgi:hypothetical protein